MAGLEETAELLPPEAPPADSGHARCIRASGVSRWPHLGRALPHCGLVLLGTALCGLALRSWSVGSLVAGPPKPTQEDTGLLHSPGLRPKGLRPGGIATTRGAVQGASGDGLFGLPAGVALSEGGPQLLQELSSGTCVLYGCHDVFQQERACQCNAGCKAFNDCCSDYQQTCMEHATHIGRAGAHGNATSTNSTLHKPKHKFVPPPPPPPPCHLKPKNKSECAHPRVRAHPSISAAMECLCPPPLVPDRNESCNDCHLPKKAQQMTFYMYRAMGKERYDMANVNMASLAGVMWYLHREVVASIPRKFHIDRIERYSVTVKTTDDYYNHTPNQFGPFVAFDSGSAKGRSKIWEKYGFVVGCQLVDPNLYNYVPPLSEQPSCFPRTAFPCRAPKWYSLPGPCPEEPKEGKEPECVRKWPGGMCPSADVTGSHTCTYYAAHAGEILLDELEGIDDYDSWWIGTNASTGARTPNGNIEYDPSLDAGVGMDFWDGRHDKENCTRRMKAVQKLFREKYPDLPLTLPEPPCN